MAEFDDDIYWTFIQLETVVDEDRSRYNLKEKWWDKGGKKM